MRTFGQKVKNKAEFLKKKLLNFDMT